MANDKVGASLNDSYDKKEKPIDIHICDRAGNGFESLTISEALDLAADIIKLANEVLLNQKGTHHG